MRYELLPVKNQQETIFESSVTDMDKFFGKVNKFEKITNTGLDDIWKQCGP